MSAGNTLPGHRTRIENGGMPAETSLMTGRAVFTPVYAVIPRGVMRDIVTSNLPFWNATRAWILARPLSGFAETFAHYLMEVAGGGGSERPEPENGAQGILYVMEGAIELRLEGAAHAMTAGGYAYLPPGVPWSLCNPHSSAARFHWLRKLYEPVEGLAPPPPMVTSEAAQTPRPVAGSNGKWTNTAFIDPQDMRHDMQVNIVDFQPGGMIPFEETHVMEHGLYVLSGKGVYKLNQDWVEVEAGDYMWLRAFCPQACYAGGQEVFRYLLYKDINRHARLRGVGGFGR